MATNRDLVGPTTVRIDDRCTACGSCLITCAPRALVRAPKKPLVIDDRCTACGACVEICPVGAIDEFALVPRGRA